MHKRLRLNRRAVLETYLLDGVSERLLQIEVVEGELWLFYFESIRFITI